MAEKLVIDGFDFGVDTGVIRDKMDLWELPAEIVEQRAVPKTIAKKAVKAASPKKNTAVKAVEAEVKAEESEVEAATEFDFEGVHYTVAPSDDWDLEVFEAWEDQNMVTVVRTLLGDKQWTKFKAKPRERKDLFDLFDAIIEAQGTEQGE